MEKINRFAKKGEGLKKADESEGAFTEDHSSEKND